MKWILFGLLFISPAIAEMTTPPKSSELQYLVSKNKLANPGFELGQISWTSSPQATTTTVEFAEGARAAVWDATSSGQFMSAETLSLTSNSGYKNQNGVASCKLLAGSGTPTHTIEVYDGSNILASQTVSTSTTNWIRNTINFSFPSSGTVRLRFQSQTNEPQLYIDDCFFGLADGYNLSVVSQAGLVATGYIEVNASCDALTRSSTTLGSFATDTDCTGPVVEFNPGPGTLQTTDANGPVFTVNNLPPGYYRVNIRSAWTNTFATGNPASFAVSDGTTTSGSTASMQSTVNGGSGIGDAIGYFNYTTSGNRTFTLYGASSSGTTTLYNGGNNARIQFSIERWPSSNEQAYNASQLPASWSGYLDQDCAFSDTNNDSTYRDVSADASCTAVETNNVNFGTVSAGSVNYTTGAGTTGSASPQIIFTPSRAGRYLTCVTAGIGDTVAAAQDFMRLYDGTTIMDEVNMGATVANARLPVKLCGVTIATSTAAKTVKLQTGRSGGAGTMNINNNASATGMIYWSVTALDQSFPAPLLVNTVVNNTNASVLNFCSAEWQTTVSSTTAPTRNYGNCFGSMTTSGTGLYDLPINAGVFSAAPTCYVTNNNAGASQKCNLNGSATSSSVPIACYAAGGSTAANGRPSVICVGPK